MPVNHWDDRQAQENAALDMLCYRAQQLGSDPLSGPCCSGASSAKVTVMDALGFETAALAITGPGDERAITQERDCILLEQASLSKLAQSQNASDEALRAYLSRCRINPEQATPPASAALHALIDRAHIDHSYPAAVMSLACAPDAAERVRAIYGDSLLYEDVDALDLSTMQRIAAAVKASSASGILLGRAGLITWGDSSRACYDNSLALIQLAEKSSKPKPETSTSATLSDDARRELLAGLLPIIRGRASGNGAVVMNIETSPAAIATVSGSAMAAWVRSGAPTAAHSRMTGARPLYIAPDELTLEAHIAALPEVITTPTVALRGLGLVTIGPDIETARVISSYAHQTLAIIASSQSLGSYAGLGDAAGADLQAASSDQEFAGKIALVTGSANGIGRATAVELASRGAHVIIADINAEGGQAVKEAIEAEHGAGRATFVQTDVRSEEAVQHAVNQAVLNYGGLDVLVNNAGISDTAPLLDTTMQMYDRNVDILLKGYFLMARESVRVMTAQAIGGVMIFVGSKNSIGPATTSSVYSAAKAAEIHMARCLAEEL